MQLRNITAHFTTENNIATYAVQNILKTARRKAIASRTENDHREIAGRSITACFFFRALIYLCL